MDLDRVSDNKTSMIGGAIFAFFLLMWLFRHLTKDS